MKKFKVSIVIDTKKTYSTTIEAETGTRASTMALDDSIRAN
ncbi:hypothetical protein FACS1894166_10680 [Bacilli bacterium]|nr:hypothetical protein FACS1894166_10680 [Bacilli bacterium]